MFTIYSTLLHVDTFIFRHCYFFNIYIFCIFTFDIPSFGIVAFRYDQFSVLLSLDIFTFDVIRGNRNYDESVLSKAIFINNESNRTEIWARKNFVPQLVESYQIFQEHATRRVPSLNFPGSMFSNSVILGFRSFPGLKYKTQSIIHFGLC